MPWGRACGVRRRPWPRTWKILDPQIAQAFAQALTEAAGKIEKPQVKIDADVEKACGVHMDQVGLIIVPQKDITPENEAVNSDPGAPLAHLFMSPGFAPVIDDKPIDAAKLRSLTFAGQDGAEHKVNYLALAARHTDDDVWHLYAYGADEKPLLDIAGRRRLRPGHAALGSGSQGPRRQHRHRRGHDLRSVPGQLQDELQGCRISRPPTDCD